MKLTDANKIRDYVKEQINPYGKPFDGSAYEFGLKLIKYLENMSTDYDIDKVVSEIRRCSGNGFRDIDGDYVPPMIETKEAIEIVKHVGVSDDTCEWKKHRIIDNVQMYDSSCYHEFEKLCVKKYKYCPYCGKKIKVVK